MLDKYFALGLAHTVDIQQSLTARSMSQHRKREYEGQGEKERVQSCLYQNTNTNKGKTNFLFWPPFSFITCSVMTSSF